MVHIVQLTDLHVRPFGLPAYRVSESNMLVERALRAVGRLRPVPDAVIITGDLTDCGLAAEYAELKAMLAREIAVPLYVIPGNHDRREAFLEAFGMQPAPAGFVDYAVDVGPVRLVMLDTIIPGSGAGELRPPQLAWLDETLAAVPGKPTMIGMHHPAFATGILHMDAILLQNPETFAEVVDRHPQVQLIAAGHVHRQITSRIAHSVAITCPSVVTQVSFDMRTGAVSSFVKEPPQFGLHRWTPEYGFVSHTAFVEEYEGPYPFVLPPEYPGRPEGIGGG
jgi:3',5'-cyclic AMP phosphodiesterase CpdA